VARSAYAEIEVSTFSGTIALFEPEVAQTPDDLISEPV
jgi:hypothetical protein